MSFQAYGVAEACLVERFELCGPVNESLVNGRPLDLAGVVFHGVLAVAMMDAVFGQKLPRRGKCVKLSAHHCIGGIPVERQVWGFHGVERAGSFAAGGGVALELVLE